MKKSTGVVLVIIIVLLFGVIGVGGYFVIKGNNDSNKVLGELKNEIVAMKNDTSTTVNNTNTENKSVNASKNSDKDNANEVKDFSQNDLTFKGITLGMSKSQVEGILGQSERENSHTEDATGNEIIDLGYDSKYLTVGIERDANTKKEAVKTIIYNGNEVVTRGLKVSSTYEQVVNAFKKSSILNTEEVNGEKTVTVGYPGDDPVYNVNNKGKIIFSIGSDNKVKSITITYGHEN
ncbi:MAG: hypothetical protein IKE01_00870 [Clostridia bacterium]|nr:hypothetical protein [Clostridia bacterium]